MAINASLIHVDGKITLDLYPESAHNWLAADPDDRTWSIYIYADLDLLDAGTYRIVGIEALDVLDITDESIRWLVELDLPRVNVPEAGMVDSTVSDVLRWARKVFPSRYSTASA